MTDNGTNHQSYRGPERLEAYRLARAHTRAMKRLLDKAKTRGFADLVDQTRRSCASVPANIREAYEEHSPGRKAYFYRVARASISEAAGHTDTLVDFELVAETDTEEVRNYQKQLIPLLITMARNQERRAALSGESPDPPRPQRQP